MVARSEQVQIARKLNRMEQELSEIRELNKALLKRMEELESESHYPPESRSRRAT